MNRNDRFTCSNPFLATSNSLFGDIYRVSAMLSMSKEYSSPPDVRNVSDDRIHPQLSRGRFTKVESTVDGDVVFIEPSFENSITSSSNSSCRSRSVQAREPQSRSPQQDRKTLTDNEERNPCSPGDHLQASSHLRRHTRNLSSLFDATSIGRNNSIDSGEICIDDEFLSSGRDRKHKREMSNGFVGNSIAHRRLNSIGTSQSVNRRQGHQREDSLGLDILSAAVEASQDELAQAAVEQGLPRRTQLEPRPTQAQPFYRRPYSSHPTTYSLPPSHGRHFAAPPPHGAYASGPMHSAYTHTSYVNGGVPSYFAPNFIARQGYPIQQYPTQHSMRPPPKSSMYPPENRALSHDFVEHRPPQQKPTDWARGNQGAQNLPAVEKKHSIHSINEDGTFAPPRINSHHRHLSSFGSVGLGSILNASLMSPGKDLDVSHVTTDPKPHHRSSSSVSFLNGLDVCGMVGSADETFLRNLQEASNNAYQSPTPMDVNTENAPTNNVSSYTGNHEQVRSPNKLASGGTSKRIRRKCTISGCINRVVQGGLCIAHGAKRKVCGHPGCIKNVKKSGLCSTHGPARRRCEIISCSKVAVQGGRCIAHGAKKKVCAMHGCDKQAILSGMCKKHHDECKCSSNAQESEGSSDGSGASRKSVSMHKSNHTRGLSIFHEIMPNEIESIINAETLRADPDPEQLTSASTDGFW